jgi:predicted DsbA family dithiol-disulfide isomerase
MKRESFCLGAVLLGFSFFACTAFSQSADLPKEKEPLAIVAGQPVYDADLVPHIQSQMRQLKNQEYEFKRKALENLIDQKLLEAEAKKLGTTEEDLLDQEVNSKVAEPADAEVEAFYLGQRDRINRPFDEIKPQLRQALKRAKLEQARREYLQGLRAKAEVSILLHPPKIEVGYDPARFKGDVNAPVRIIEFSDFQCPFCRRANGTINELLEKYQGRVSLAYRDFPLRQIHPQAESAAEASRCAAEQGRFWEYHDLLFGDSPKFDAASLSAYAGKVGLDSGRFQSCLSSGKYKTQIDEDLQEGKSVGVSGTPAFFINGVFLSGAQPASAFEKIIDAELAASHGGGSN